MATLFVAAATLTGGLLGFALGVGAAVTGIPPATPWVVVLVTILALAADVVAAGIRPLSVGRQVPQAWSRLFAPPIVAVLYGGRLGVGPLTILTTWLWWAAALVAATLGPGTSALAGGVFGLVRTVVVVVAAQRVGQAGAVAMARLRGVERLAHWGCAAVAASGAGLAVIL